MVDLPPLAENEIRCGACRRGFVPINGLINVIRKNWDDPGAPVCPTCFGNLASRNMLEKDDTRFKCTCDSLDPSKLPCKVHVNAPPHMRVM